jgi:hypothetical protein
MQCYLILVVSCRYELINKQTGCFLVSLYEYVLYKDEVLHYKSIKQKVRSLVFITHRDIQTIFLRKNEIVI